VIKTRMSYSNSALFSSPARAILKLKGGARKSPRESKSTPPGQIPNNPKLKPGARWSSSS
jgi:hypothetical protein